MATSSNVAVGKPKVGGAIYRAPLGTTLPTSTADTLDKAFISLGYISEDGLTNSDSKSFNDFKAWGGDIVQSSLTERNDTWKFKMIEVLSEDVLKAAYGKGNVSGTLATGVTVKANSDSAEDASYVIDMIMNGAAKRVVIPKGKITELGDIVYKDDDLAGYEVTVTSYPDSSGNTHYEYIKTAA